MVQGFDSPLRKKEFNHFLTLCVGSRNESYLLWGRHLGDVSGPISYGYGFQDIYLKSESEKLESRVWPLVEVCHRHER
jgi:hypothetical protein